MNARWLIPALAAIAIAAPAARAQQAPSTRRETPGAPSAQFAPMAESDDPLAWLGDDDGLFDGPMMLDDQEGGGPGPSSMMRDRHGAGAGRMRDGRGPGGPMAGRWAMRNRMRMRLASVDLTDEQREKLLTIRDNARRKTIPMQGDLALARLDLNRMLRADRPEVAAINAQIDKMARIRADMAKARMAARLEARAVFTPDQWKKLHEPPTMRRGPGAPGGGSREGEGGSE